MKKTVFLANNNSILSETICAMISLHPDYQIIGVCHNGIEAEQFIMGHRPQIALLDESLLTYCGLTVVQQMRAAGVDTKFALLTQNGNTARMRKAVECGVLGYLSDTHLSKQLVQCLDTMSANNYFIDFDFILSKPAQKILGDAD